MGKRFLNWVSLLPSAVRSDVSGSVVNGRATGRTATGAATGTIDRRALVDRHRVVLADLSPQSPLSVGNGEFCFTADLTGLQTFPAAYPVGPRDEERPDGTLLGTYAQWGWHTEPTDPEPALSQALVSYDSPHGPVAYVDMGGSISGGTESATPAGELWLRANPHRLHLGLLGFVEDSDDGPRDLRLAEVRPGEQWLDLWTGLLTSVFGWRGHQVTVATVCDPDHDRLAVRIDSPALMSGLAVRMAFAYGSQDWHNGADWSRPDDHHTTVRQLAPHRWLIDRRLDATRYQVLITGSDSVQVEQCGRHQLLIRAESDHAELVIDFLDGTRTSSDVESLAGSETGAAAVIERAATSGAAFWSSGAAIDLSAVEDPRAVELERRIVLSQYLTKINCSGSLPPAETGLVCNSWRGKFHLEMHWWHAAHFALWDRPELLRRSLDCIEKSCRRHAKPQPGKDFRVFVGPSRSVPRHANRRARSGPS